jgi:hypothetical protein
MYFIFNNSASSEYYIIVWSIKLSKLLKNERLWNAAGVTVDILSWNMYEDTEENHENSQNRITGLIVEI